MVALVAYALQLCFFRLQDRPPVDRKVSDGRHSCRAYATSATKGNSSAKKKLISLPANRSPAQAMVAQAKMPCM